VLETHQYIWGNLWEGHTLLFGYLGNYVIAQITGQIYVQRQ